MAGWLSRLLGGDGDSKDANSKKAARAPAPNPFPLSTPAPAPAAPASGAAPQVAAIHRFGVRRPLVGRNGEMAGFEFRLARNLEQRLQARPDVSVQAAYVVTLLSSMQSTLEAGREALATVSAEVLIRPLVFDQAGPGLRVLVHPWESADPEAPARLAALRAKGVKLGRAAPEEPQPLPVDFVQFAYTPEQAPAFWARLSQWRSAQPDMGLLVTELEGIEDLERAQKLGVELAAGRVDRNLVPPPAPEDKPMQTGMLRLCQLLNDVMQDRDTAHVAGELRADVTLSYKLLRYVNSPAVGLKRSVESIDQAVTVLGRNELYRWISVLLLTGAEGRAASRAMQEIALARARLLETLAEQKADPVNHPPGALFTVGLLSLLDVMMRRPLAQALQPLRLSDAALQALIERNGPWADYLRLAGDLERHDMAAATVIAMEFGGVAKVLELSDAAWQWAAAVGKETRAPASAA